MVKCYRLFSYYIIKKKSEKKYKNNNNRNNKTELKVYCSMSEGHTCKVEPNLEELPFA